MPILSRPFGLAAVVIAIWTASARPAWSQTDFGIDPESFVSSDAGEAWNAWVTAMQAALMRDADTMGFAFDQLLSFDPSPMRLALFADRTVKNTREGGGVLMLEQDLEAGSLDGPARTIAERLVAGREQMNQADDGFYFASIGQFAIANANIEALTASDVDPVALLEFIDRVPRRRQVMLMLADHPIVGASMSRLAEMLLEGERRISADPTRIRQNVTRLGGTQRGFTLAVDQLRESGEFAVPFLVQTLSDASRTDLARHILRAIPEIGRPAVNPLVMALRSRDPVIQSHVANSLGKIGYAQAAPYLLELRAAQGTSAQVRDAALNAAGRLNLTQLGMNTAMTPAEAYLALAEAYYANAGSVAADPRYATANVWYWRDELLINVEVPTPIFNEVMAMRCCEEALRHDPRSKEAIALWVAANIRREAELGPDQADPTRPDGFPSAAYFAQSAGAEYCLMALDRALHDSDPVVALGAIEALRKTAGRDSLLGMGGRSGALSRALAFPDRIVRIHAAFALAGARPNQAFSGSENLLPVLAEALAAHTGRMQALVIDPHDDTANQLGTALRGIGWDVITAGGLLSGLQQTRSEGAGVDAIFVCSTLPDSPLIDALAQIRGEFRFASTPLFIIAQPGDAEIVDAAIRVMPDLARVVANADPDGLQAQILTASEAAGRPMLTPDLGMSLALEGAALLSELGRSAPNVFDLTRVQEVALAALEAGDPGLQVAAADVLSYTRSNEAQRALADAAMSNRDEAVRLAMFAALADSARSFGSNLTEPQVKALIDLAESEPNLTLRTAASQALGALNLTANPASQIIRNLYGG